VPVRRAGGLAPIPVNEQQELTTKTLRTQGYAKGFLSREAGICLLKGIEGSLLFFAHLCVLGAFAVNAHSFTGIGVSPIVIHLPPQGRGDPMDEMIIRHAEPSDHQPIVAVVDEWWGGRKMAGMLPKLFFVHFRPTSFVAEYNGEVAGFVSGFVSQTYPNEAYIHFVGVHPEFRKHGLARALYEKFFAAVASLGCRTVRCVTSPLNKGSILFHQSMGFSVVGSENMVDGIPVFEGYDGKGEDRVLFSKTLAGGRV